MLSAPQATEPDIQHLAALALAEDGRDLTTEAVFIDNPLVHAEICAQQTGVLCGTELVKAVYQQIDPQVVLTFHRLDSAAVVPGECLIHLAGKVQSLLRGERPALNFLQQLSGVASLTAAYVAAVAGTGTVILDTRKTIPGWRRLQKYAVRVGGGQNHRLNLEELCLIKDNHITAAGSIAVAVQRVKTRYPTLPIEVEAARLEDVEICLALGVQRIMLDNFSVDDAKRAVKMVNRKVPLEVSGGLDLQTVVEFAAAGVDYASVGRLTHSAPALDIHMEICS